MVVLFFGVFMYFVINVSEEGVVKDVIRFSDVCGILISVFFIYVL